MLSYLGSSFLFDKLSESTAELCPPHKRACNKAIHNIY